MNVSQIAQHVIRWWEVRATDLGEIDAGDLVDHYLSSECLTVYGDVSEIVEEVVRLNFGNRTFGDDCDDYDDCDAWQPPSHRRLRFSAVPLPRS